MKPKQITITFGTSVHFFKSSVSMTFDCDKNFSIDDANKEVKKAYLEVLSQELALSKKFEGMTTKEIRKFLKRSANAE